MNPDESKNRTVRIAPFVLAVLCFLMPFVEISCKDEKGKVVMQQSFTGLKLAFGGTTKQTNPMTNQVEDQEVKQQSQLLIALLCAAAGAASAFMAGKNGKLFPAIAGIAGLIFLLLGKGEMSGNLPPDAKDTLGINMQIGFWLACVCCVVGAVISGRQWKEDNSDAPPPPGGSYGSNLPPVPNQPPPAPPASP
jgi:hypothetical protein